MQTTTVQAKRYPVYPEDVFSSDALRQPFEHYRRIRDLGPVVRLDGLDVLALSRFNDVKAALQTPDIMICGAGNGFNDVWNTPPNPPLIMMDGAPHRRLRSYLARPMMPKNLEQHRGLLKAMITEKVREVADGKTFDGVSELARHLPLAAVSFLVGLPEAGRQNMLRWANALFNVIGPISPAFSEDLQTFLEFSSYLRSVDPAQFPEGGWAHKMFVAAEQGGLTLDEARAALSALVAPSLDTTINAKSNLLYNLAINPDQWNKLKRDPSLIPSAVVEGVRHSATVRWFARVAAKDYSMGDVMIPEGTRVMVMFGSANRDERHYDDPDTFQVGRNPQDQLGWGAGPHVCAGLHLAKLEMQVLLEALVENVETLEADEPVLGANRGLYGLESLPMRLTRVLD